MTAAPHFNKLAMRLPEFIAVADRHTALLRNELPERKTSRVGLNEKLDLIRSRLGTFVN